MTHLPTTDELERQWKENPPESKDDGKTHIDGTWEKIRRLDGVRWFLHNLIRQAEKNDWCSPKDHFTPEEIAGLRKAKNYAHPCFCYSHDER
jgi:hypothetical protein